MTKKLTVIDLFSGCGGLSAGFEEAGYEILAGIDNWQDALNTFEYNHKGSKVFNLDLAQYDPKTVSREIGESVDVVIGGPPCQGFSISGKRDPKDPRNLLYKSFVETVKYFKPKAFLLENVPNLISMDKGAAKDAIIKEFSELGYSVNYKVLLASDYGVPQNRRRVFFIGLLEKETFIFPEPTTAKHKISSCDAISDLPEGSIEDGAEYPNTPKSDYQRMSRKGVERLYNHQITIHTPQTVAIIAQVPDGGNYKDLPKNLHNTRKVNIAWTRLNSSLPSFTIDTGHNHHFHYVFNRVPTARESARLQSFPDSFVFLGGKTSQLKQIGNAVPPLLAKAVAEELEKYIRRIK